VDHRSGCRGMLEYVEKQSLVPRSRSSDPSSGVDGANVPDGGNRDSTLERTSAPSCPIGVAVAGRGVSLADWAISGSGRRASLACRPRPYPVARCQPARPRATPRPASARPSHLGRGAGDV
jgi:hypothetical protein